jgi:hypothetical protein
MLRSLTWWATILIGGVWALRTGTSHLELAIAFLALAWLGVHAELVFLARRGQLIRSDPRPPDNHWRTWRPLVSSFSTTAWTVLLGVNVLDAANIHDWLAPAALFGAASMMWFALAGNLGSVREQPHTDSERLGVCLGVQSAGLLIATISLAMGGWGEVVAWLCLGVTSIVAGKWLRARAFDIYGIVVLTICAGRLLLMDSWMFGLAGGGEHVFGFVLTKWAGLMAATGAAWVSMGILVRPGSSVQSWWTRTSNFMVGVGIALAGASLFHSEAAIWTPPVIAATVSLAMVLAGRPLKSTGLSSAGLLLQVVGTLLLLRIEWWDQTPASAISLLGFYIVPAALAAPYVGLTWLPTTRLAATGPNAKHAVDVGLAICISLAFAPLLHAQVLTTSLATALLTAGLVTMALGSLRRSAGLIAYGVVVLGSGTIATIATTWWETPAWCRIMGLELGAGTLVALYGALAWMATAIAALRVTVAERNHLARICAAIAFSLLLACLWHENVHLGSLCVAWLMLSTAVGAARKIRSQLNLDLFMLLGLLAASVVWVVNYATEWQSSTATLLMHPGLWLALLLAGAWLVGRHWTGLMEGRNEELCRTMQVLTGLAAALLIFTSTSLEVARIAASLADEPRVRAAAVSIWWGIFAVLLIAAGFWRRSTPSRHAGLGLLAVAMGKAVILDLQGVPQLWRIASFIGLGLLMLGVAVVYSKVSVIWNERIAAEPEAARGPVTS